MAIIGIHQFKVIISALTKSELDQLIKLLKVPRKSWNAHGYSDKPPYALSYAFGNATQSAYLCMGNESAPTDTMQPGTHTTHQYYETEGAFNHFIECHEAPEDYERYYRKVSLTLHGTWFDHSSFDFRKLLEFIFRLGFDPRELDIYYDDPPNGVTTLKDWLRCFTKYKLYCIGAMLKRQQIDVLKANEVFTKVEIGKSGVGDPNKDKTKKTTKTLFASFYQRPDGTKRLEMKLRKSGSITNLLHSILSDETGKVFHQEAIEFLIRNLEIFTKESRATKKPELYVREPFWDRFLVYAPRIKKIAEAKKKKNRDELYKSEKLSFQGLVGRLMSHLTRYETVVNHRSIADELMGLSEQIRIMPHYSIVDE